MLLEVVAGVDLHTLEMGVENEVHHARYRVRTVHRGGTTGEDVDALDQRRGNLVDVGEVTPAPPGPGLRRRSFTSTSVRWGPRPRRLTFAVPSAPFEVVEFMPANTIGRLLRTSSTRVRPVCVMSARRDRGDRADRRLVRCLEARSRDHNLLERRCGGLCRLGRSCLSVQRRDAGRCRNRRERETHSLLQAATVRHVLSPG